MSFNSTPYKSRPAPGQLGSTPFRSSSASKFRSSLVPSSRPSPVRAASPSTKSTKTSAGARDLFRTSTPRTQRTTEFAPDLPAEVTRPPASVRKFAPRKSVSTGMSNTTSTEPFKMRIPSPDPDLTGQVVAQAVPDDPNRTGSIYADQFLARKCPSHFDELQRRQFFCILDLRRLKYAADEIFAQKDWKLNILNFAKEYEKSRGLIMLRYGLYEFKNVKPSSEVLKKWRAAHGLPPEPEDDQASSPNRQKAGTTASTKRKADEELTPRDNTLMVSNANQNKRRNLAHEVDDSTLTVPAPFKKSKRKADETEEVDENKPNKQLKPTPSAATSLLANIINKPSNGGASPLKPSSQTSLFGISKPNTAQDSNFATKANPFQPTGSSLFPSPAKTNNVGTPSGSVFASSNVVATPTASAGNIFGYLSESSPSSSGNEKDDADDHETDSEPEPDSEEQGPSAAVSTGTSTPPVQNGASLFGASKASNTSSIFGEPLKPAGQTAKGGLFGRVQLGANGQPVRANAGPDEKQEGSPKQPWAADKQETKTPAKRPGDYTFNPATTPISFGQAASDAPNSSSATNLQPDTESNSSAAKKPASSFGLNNGQVGFAPKSTAPSLFAPLGPAKLQPSEAPVSIFASQKPASTSISIFGATSASPAAKSPFGGDEQTTEASVAAEKQAVSVFDKPVTSAFVTADAKPLDTGVAKVASSIPTTKDQAPSIFDKSFIATSAAQVKALSEDSKSSSDLFSRSSNPLFGATNDEKPTSDVPAAKSQTPSIFEKSFIATSAAQVKALSEASKPSSDLFSRSSNPLFDAGKVNGTTLDSTKSIFGQPEKQASLNPTSKNEILQTPNDDNKENKGSVLGLKAAALPTAAPSIFGTHGASNSALSSTLFGEKKPEEPTKPVSSIFGSTSNTNNPIFNFGSQSTSGPSVNPTSTIFGASATPISSVSFGALNSQSNGGGPDKVGFQFGSSPNTGSASFTFGQSSSSGSGFTFTTGADKKINNPFASDKQTINNPFTASQPGSQSTAPPPGGNSFTATPSSSFAFSFGQQPSSTPAVTPSSQASGIFGGSAKPNGASSFSFTQALPGQNGQNTLDSKFPKSSTLMNPSSLLQANGDVSTRANSPFPAPSSIGTTPVNGTPEPQAPHEDGEEVAQQQISLTEGGPGEEDETILHEVRAKAIKYIPVQPGDDDEGKSPWSTRGVGPLRVLKNRSTGAVRVLLRAEPRGHIALNKTILPDMEYKSRSKTVNFVTANDDGSGLETWMLQVKKPEFASTLAEVLEANKIANKK